MKTKTSQTTEFTPTTEAVLTGTVLTDTALTGTVSTEIISKQRTDSETTQTAGEVETSVATPLVLGTPLLHMVNANVIGRKVPIQNTFTHTLAAQGNFGGGQVNIEWSLDGAGWSPLLDKNGQRVAFTTNTLKVGLSFNCIYLRAILTGATNPQNVTVIVG